MTKRTLIIAAAFSAATLILSGCSAGGTGNGDEKNDDADASGVVIGGVALNAYDAFWITLMCGATTAAEDAGATMEWKAAQNSDQMVISANLDAVALSHPDGVIVPGDTAYSAKAQTIMSDGTPVIAVNTPMTPATEYSSVISGADNTDFAEYVAEQIGAEGSVGILAGIAGYDVLAQRYQPVIDQLAEVAPNVTVLDLQYDDFDRTKAATVTSNLILANPDLRAIYAISGPEGEGAAAAIQQAGKEGEILLFTYDATPDVVAGIQDGTVTAALAQSPFKMGEHAVQMILDYAAAGKTGPVQAGGLDGEVIDLAVLTADNIGDPEMAPYIYSTTCG